MAGITGPVAVAIGVSATTTRSGNRSRPHIAQLRDLRLNGRTAILQGTQGIGHVEPPKAERSATLGFRAQATESCGSAILCRAPPVPRVHDIKVEVRRRGALPNNLQSGR